MKKNYSRLQSPEKKTDEKIWLKTRSSNMAQENATDTLAQLLLMMIRSEDDGDDDWLAVLQQQTHLPTGGSTHQLTTAKNSIN